MTEALRIIGYPINDKNLNSEIETCSNRKDHFEFITAINDKNLNSEIETRDGVDRHSLFGVLSMIRISILRLKLKFSCEIACGGSIPN